MNRLNKFNLEVAEDKTKIIRFGRKVYEEYKNGKGPKPPTFDFLGFTHYCSSRKDGSFRVKRKTSAKKFSNSLKRCKIWLMKNRTLPIDSKLYVGGSNIIANICTSCGHILSMNVEKP